MRYKFCNTCQRILHIEEFYRRKDGSKTKVRSQCKTCFSRKIREIMEEKRIRIKKERGGKCELCGYCKCIDALEFHHKNNKKDIISNMIRSKSYEKILKETKSCQLVCANCHREIHAWGCRSGQTGRP